MGAQVQALARRPAATLPEPLRHPAVTILRGDLSSAEAVAATVGGASLVFHLAGCAKPWARDPGEYTRVNVNGTDLVCRAALESGARRLVHTSTNLVEPGDAPGRKPRLTAYQRTKAEAEDRVAGWVARGLHVTIVRPGRVFGPGPLTPANAATQLIDQYRRGLFRFRLADGGARGSWVFVGDVVDGMIAAAERGQPGSAYTLGGENLPVRGFLAAIASVTGRRYRTLPLPVTAARGAAALAEWSARLGATPFITRDWVDLLAQDWPSSSVLATTELGYAPRPLRDALQETIRWLEAGGGTW